MLNAFKCLLCSKLCRHNQLIYLEVIGKFLVSQRFSSSRIFVLWSLIKLKIPLWYYEPQYHSRDKKGIGVAHEITSSENNPQFSQMKMGQNRVISSSAVITVQSVLISYYSTPSIIPVLTRVIYKAMGSFSCCHFKGRFNHRGTWKWF